MIDLIGMISFSDCFKMDDPMEGIDGLHCDAPPAEDGKYCITCKDVLGSNSY